MSPGCGCGGIIYVVVAETDRLLGRAEEIYSRYAQALVRFATGLVGPWDAPDVVSDAMLRCLRSVDWDSVADEKAFLYRAVLNEARSFRRSADRRLARDRASAAMRQPLEGAAELRPEVLEAVRTLSVRQRAVIVLTYWEDLTPVEVGARLGIGEGSVRRHLARARERLRRILHDN